MRKVWDFMIAVLVVGVISFILLIGILFYSAYYYFLAEKTIESKNIIMPTYKLTVDDDKIDTIYVYKFK